MKNYLFIISTLVCLLSCNKESEILVVNETTSSQIIKPFMVGSENACKIAEDYINLLGMDNRSNSRKIRSIQHVSNSKTARVASGIESNGVYVINYENNSGFAVVSADTRDSVAVYLMSEVGNIIYDTDNTLSPIFYIRSLIEDYQQEIVNNSVMARDPSADYQWETETNIIEKKGAFLETRWRQRYPYNIYLQDRFGDNYSDKTMGCAPVAISQIMAYYQYPKQYNNGSEITLFDWNRIGKVKEGVSHTLSDIYAVSSFIYNVGLSAEANYHDLTTNATPVFSYKVPIAFRRMGYSCSNLTNYNYSLLKSELYSARPVFMRGTSSDSSSGHAWVVDGYTEIEEVTTVTDENGNIVESTITEEFSNVKTYHYIHINTGWGDTLNNTMYYHYETAVDDIVWTNSVIFSTYSENQLIVTGITPGI